MAFLAPGAIRILPFCGEVILFHHQGNHKQYKRAIISVEECLVNYLGYANADHCNAHPTSSNINRTKLSPFVIVGEKSHSRSIFIHQRPIHTTFHL